MRVHEEPEQLAYRAQMLAYGTPAQELPAPRWASSFREVMAYREAVDSMI